MAYQKVGYGSGTQPLSDTNMKQLEDNIETVKTTAEHDHPYMSNSATLDNIPEGTTNKHVTLTEKNNWNAKESAITKKTAFNKDFGTNADTIAEGNHAHSNYSSTSHIHDDRYYTESETDTKLAGKSDFHTHPYSLNTHNHAGIYEPVFSKSTAFNKNFGTGTGTVSEGNHSHSGYVPTSRTVNSKALSTNITLTSDDVGAVSKSGGTLNSGATLTMPSNSNLNINGNITINNTSGLNFTYGNKIQCFVIDDSGWVDSDFKFYAQGSNYLNLWCSYDSYGGSYTYRFYPTTSMILGTSSYRWGQIYSTNSTISTSDERLKTDIKLLDNRHKNVMLNLIPKTFKLLDEEKMIPQTRFHTGFISQDLEKLLIQFGLDSTEFAAFIKSPKEKRVKKQILSIDEVTGQEITKDVEVFENVLDVNGNQEYIYSLRYEELIAPLLQLVQDLYKRVEVLESKA